MDNKKKLKDFKTVVSVSFPIGIVQQLDELSKHQGVSRAEFVRQVVEGFLSKKIEA